LHERLVAGSLELQAELHRTREDLEGTVAELQAANEEQTSANEEAQSLNEELQSSNEELETSKEEMQSVNEELQTVNAELHSKLEVLAEVNDDLRNLLDSTQIATLFLHRDLRVKRFTNETKKVIRLIESDVGRPLGDLVTNLDYADLLQDVEVVLRTLVPKEREVAARDGAWYTVRITPYRTIEDVIDGAVVTFVDVSRIKRAEESARAAQGYAEGVIQTLREPLVVLDADLRVVSANRAFHRAFEAEPRELEGLLIYTVGGRQLDVPALRQLLEDTLARNAAFEDFELEQDSPKLGRRRMLLNARRLERGGDHPSLILLAFEDVTERGSGKDA
jgi:two-component system CheB/CheR fusion protein